jgi:cohesin loading factor subunit SCC2
MFCSFFQITYDEDLDDDMESVLSRLPADLTAFQQSLATSQGCLLLLVLREHLKVKKSTKPC